MIRISTPDPNKPIINWIRYTVEKEMNECPLCKTELPNDHPALNLVALETYVKSKGGWEVFESNHVNYGYPEGKSFSIAPKTGTFGNKILEGKIVAKKIKYDSGDIERDYYDGDLPQGTTFETYIVVEIEGAFYKKTGTGDSYGEVSWDGDLKIVTPTEKVIRVFE